MSKWEHKTMVMKFSEKGFAISRKDVFQGLNEESQKLLTEVGEEGWELVSVIPVSTGGAGFFSSTQAKTDAALGFFKRLKG